MNLYKRLHPDPQNYYILSSVLRRNIHFFVLIVSVMISCALTAFRTKTTKKKIRYQLLHTRTPSGVYRGPPLTEGGGGQTQRTLRGKEKAARARVLVPRTTSGGPTSIERLRDVRHGTGGTSREERSVLPGGPSGHPRGCQDWT